MAITINGVAISDQAIAEEWKFHAEASHIIHVARRIDGRQLPFGMAKDRIAQFPSGRVRHNALRQYLQILAGKAGVSGINLGAADSPLVR